PPPSRDFPSATLLPYIPLPTHPAVFLCISVLRRPPRPTRFPYTTLFRSTRLRGGRDRARIGRLYFLPSKVCLTRSQVTCERVRQDRKSTRLNSSHVEISYAVFCLEKKNATLLVLHVDVGVLHFQPLLLDL